jgi:hypothetical protein
MNNVKLCTPATFVESVDLALRDAGFVGQQKRARLANDICVYLALEFDRQDLFLVRRFASKSSHYPNDATPQSDPLALVRLHTGEVAASIDASAAAAAEIQRVIAERDPD